MARTETRFIVSEPKPGVLEVLYEGYGRRLVSASATRSQTVWRKRCLHGRPIGLDNEHLRPGDTTAWTQICRLCAYELEHLSPAGAP